MKKVLVVKLYVDGEKSKQKVLKAVSGLRLQGVYSIKMDLENEKLTVIGNIESDDAVKLLKKLGNAKMLFFGPATEPQQEDNGGVIC